MKTARAFLFLPAIFLLGAILTTLCISQAHAQLPRGVKAVLDLKKAYREKTPTRERVCLNGLWRWQPAKDVTDVAPNDKWRYFKVPDCWPGITDYMRLRGHPLIMVIGPKMGFEVLSCAQRDFTPEEALRFAVRKEPG